MTRYALKYFSFFSALTLLIFKEYWSLFFFGRQVPFLSEIVFITSLLLALSVFLTKLYTFEMGVLILAFFAFAISQNISFPLISLSIISSKDIGLKTIIKFHLALSIFLFITVVISNSLGWMPSTDQLDFRISNGKYLTRYNLGFGGANGAFLFYFPIITSAVFVSESKYCKWVNYTLLLLFALIINNYTLSRTGLYSTIAFYLLLFTIPKIKFENYKTVSFLIRISLLIFVLLSILSALFLNNSIWNERLALRPSYWLVHIMQKVYTYNFWGTPWNSNYQELITRIPLDNSFLAMILAKGAIFSLFVFLLYFYGLKTLLNENDGKSISIILAILLFSFFENTLFVVAFNISYFILYHNIIQTRNASTQDS